MTSQERPKSIACHPVRARGSISEMMSISDTKMMSVLIHGRKIHYTNRIFARIGENLPFVINTVKMTHLFCLLCNAKGVAKA